MILQTVFYPKILTGVLAVLQGDSGGPLVCLSDTEQYELVGLSSWGYAGCITSYPSVYVRVSHFKDWIDTVIAEWPVSSP